MTTSAIAGLSRARLQRIDRFLKERYIDSGRLPCAQLLVERGGELAHQSVLGLADLERRRPLADDALFRIYSMTKPITTVAFMMLVEEGRVALDDPVEKFIPEWCDLAVYVGGMPGGWLTRPTERPMQVVDLLRHTSGLTYGFQFRTNVDHAYRKGGIGEMGGKMTLETMIAALAKVPLEFSPGTAWNYSISTDVLGYLIQVITGQSFERFLAERVIGPLGIADTAFHAPPEQAARLTACYEAAPGGGVRLQDDPMTSGYLAPPAFYSGGGGLVSTAADYLKFTRMLANGGHAGGVRLLSRKTLSLMTLNHLPGGKDLTELSRSLFSEAMYAGIGFGLGFAVNTDIAKNLTPGSVGEFYWGGAASTAFWVDPAEDLTVVFMTQLMPSATWPIRRELRTLVYAAFDD